MINVTVIGFGYVGTSLSMFLLNNRHAIRLNIMEPNKQCEGAFLDLAHSMVLYPKKELHINNEELFLNADFVFFAAGDRNIRGGSRLSTMNQNIHLTKDIFEHRIFTKNPYIIVIANPVDIITYYVNLFTGFPPGKVLGTGTFLDSLRWAYYLSAMSGYKVNNFEAFVFGEHGSSQVPILSMTKLNGKPILDFSEFTTRDLDIAHRLTKDAANMIRETSKGTTYGVSKCAEMLMDYLLDGEEHFLAISIQTNDYYRSLLNLKYDICIGIPVIIKEGKIEIYNELNLSIEELDSYRKSASILATFLKKGPISKLQIKN